MLQTLECWRAVLWLGGANHGSVAFALRCRCLRARSGPADGWCRGRGRRCRSRFQRFRRERRWRHRSFRPATCTSGKAEEERAWSTRTARMARLARATRPAAFHRRGQAEKQRARRNKATKDENGSHQGIENESHQGIENESHQGTRRKARPSSPRQAAPPHCGAGPHIGRAGATTIGAGAPHRSRRHPLRRRRHPNAVGAGPHWAAPVY